MSLSDRLFLEETCASFAQRLQQKLVEDHGTQIEEQDFQDFEVSYSIHSRGPDLVIQARFRFLQDVLKQGSQALLESVWEGMPLSLAVDTGVLNITVKTQGLGNDLAVRERCAQRLVSLRTWLLIGPLVERIRWLRDATGGSAARNATMAAADSRVLPALQLQIRELETCWIICKPDRVVVIFTIHLDDEVDVALGRAFCQEFQETGRPPTNSPLPCTFSESKESPPSDLRGVPLATMPNVGFISFALSDQLVRGASEERLLTLARPIMTFRNFFNFHLKSSKSYLHSRLRKRLDGWAQNLNRTRRVKRSGEKRRLITGKEFVPPSRTRAPPTI